MSCAVLRGVSVKLPRGKVTALVGHSGAGKSTVAALISRFYKPTSGDMQAALAVLDCLLDASINMIKAQ